MELSSSTPPRSVQNGSVIILSLFGQQVCVDRGGDDDRTMSKSEAQLVKTAVEKHFNHKFPIDKKYPHVLA